MTVIVALSGGKASAWCADWALKTFDDAILYFNDTKWEHPDLYRFLGDLSKYWDHPIVCDSDGRSVEELAHDHHSLPNNRMPFCSHILKAERLQRFYKDGDVLVFGIGYSEKHRAVRLLQVYQLIATKTGKNCTLRFPMIEENILPSMVDEWLVQTGIQEPELYRLGFSHNNCSGGCVRGSKRQWRHLLRVLPDVYTNRERVENEMRESTGKDIHFLKDVTLSTLKEYSEAQMELFTDDDVTECIGICNSLA